MRRDPGGEAQEREHDVLDARARVRLAAGLDEVRVLAREVQHDRDVVRARATTARSRRCAAARG